MENQRILPPTYLLASIGAMIALHFLWPVMKLMPLPWNFLGLIPLGLGIALNIIANNAFEQVNTTIKPYQESNHLVTTGLFRFSRHPMYLGAGLMLTGIGLILGSLSPFLIVPIFMILMDRIFIEVEEKMLAEKFGQVWHAYKQKTRRWI